MLSRVGEVIAEIKNNPPPLPVDEIAEATQFLEWLVGEQLHVPGRARIRADSATRATTSRCSKSGLGILRDAERAGAAPRRTNWFRSRPRSWSS